MAVTVQPPQRAPQIFLALWSPCSIRCKTFSSVPNFLSSLFWECTFQPAKWIDIAPISQIGQFVKQMTITELLFRSSYYSSLKPVYSIHLLTRCRSHAINEKALSTNSWHRSVSDLLLLLFIGSISYILILVDWSIVFRFLLQNGKIFQSLSLKLILLCARRRWIRYSAQMFFRKLPTVV